MIFRYTATASEITHLKEEGFEPEVLASDKELETAHITIEINDGMDLLRFANAQRKDELSDYNKFLRTAS